MQLMTGYRYYCHYPDISFPGFLAKVEQVEDLSLDEWAALPKNEVGTPRTWETTKATIAINGTKTTVNAAWFAEPSKLEWRLASAFDRLGWSQAKAVKWCNALFPTKRGSLKLLAQGRYGLDECSYCVVGHWPQRQLKIAVDVAEKLVRRQLKLDTKFKHPLNCEGK
jgi:hypothetical protein